MQNVFLKPPLLSKVQPNEERRVTFNLNLRVVSQRACGTYTEAALLALRGMEYQVCGVR